MARLDKPKGEMPFTKFTRCLSQQLNGVSHLRLYSNGDRRGPVGSLISGVRTPCTYACMGLCIT